MSSENTEAIPIPPPAAAPAEEPHAHGDAPPPPDAAPNDIPAPVVDAPRPMPVVEDAPAAVDSEPKTDAPAPAAEEPSSTEPAREESGEETAHAQEPSAAASATTTAAPATAEQPVAVVAEEAESTPAPTQTKTDPPAPEPEAAPASVAPEPALPAPPAPAPEPETTPAPTAAPVTEAKAVAKASESTETAAEDPQSSIEVTPATAATPAVPAVVADEEPKKEEKEKETTKKEETKSQPEEEEPQNDLTRKFTKDEWKAVKELRAQLPEVFKKAYADSESKTVPESIALWGVTVSTTPNAKASVVLAKFVRARDLNVSAAAEMLVATLRWREEVKIAEIMQETFDPEVFGKLGEVYGKDKGGRPVTYNLYGLVKDMKAVFGDGKSFIRWRVQFMEKSIELLDFETIDQMVQVHDYEGVSVFSRDASQKDAAKEATSIFQNHYPEFLSRKYFVNVPTLLTWVFWMFKPLISAKTLAKMTVVGSGPKTIGAEMLQIVDAKELPKRYGGEAEAF